MSSLRFLALLALAVALPSTPALGQIYYPIDDFEVLGFDVIQTGLGSATDTQFVPPPYAGHLISPSRRVLNSVYGNSGTARARLQPTTNGDDVVRIDVPSQGEVHLIYDLPPTGVDLTAGGAVDRMQMYVWGPGAVDVHCSVRDTVGGHGDDETTALSGFGVVEWLLSSFGTIDRTQVTQISFGFTAPGTYYVQHIRLRGTASEDLILVPFVETAITPPLPSPPLEVQALTTIGNPLYDVSIAITEADAGFTPSLELGWSTFDSFDGEGGNLLLDWNDAAPFDLLQLDLSIGVVSGAGGMFPEMFPPDPVHGPEGVTLVFPTQLRSSPGGPVIGSSETWLTIGPGPEQATNAMEFADVLVQGNTAPLRAGSSGFTGFTGFTVSILLQPGSAGVETIWPIFEMHWWSEWTPTQVTAAPVLAPVAFGPSLVAVPSITRAGTEIRSARPFAVGAELGVYSVTGRSVATLRPSMGATRVVWDGRSDRGNTLPAGVYFVRGIGGAGEVAAAARVVKVR